MRTIENKNNEIVAYNDVYDDVKMLFAYGKSKTNISNAIRGKFNLTTAQANTIIKRAQKNLAAESKKDLENAVVKNISVLEQVIDECMEDRNYPMVIKATEVLNKMAQLYKEGEKKVEVIQQYQFNWNFPKATEQIQEAIEVNNNDTEDDE